MVVQSIIPPSYTVNVSLSTTPSGLQEPVTANIVLFTNEQANFSAPYKAYIEPTQAITDFGTNSKTAQMVAEVFAQSPDLRSANGTLYVCPYVATDATQGTFTTPDITANLEAFQAITDGGVKLTIDGKDFELKNMNFTACQSIQDVANVILAKRPDCFVTVDNGALVFASKTVGTSSSIVLNVPKSGTDITGSTLLNIAAGTSALGVNSVDTETLLEAINRMADNVYFGGILDACYRENSYITTIAPQIQATNRALFHGNCSLQNMEVLAGALKSASINKVRVMTNSNSLLEAKLYSAGYASRALAPNRNGSDTAITMNLQSIAGIKPSADATLNDVLNAKNYGSDIYVSQGRLPVNFSNSCNGFTDEILENIWIVEAMQVAGYNCLRKIGTKIPQTEAGMNALKNAYAQICEKCVRSGISAPGEWKGATFGDSEDMLNAIAQNGWYIYSQPIAQQSQAEREQRQAPLVQIAIKKAGAIHFSTLIVNVEA